MTEPVEQEWHGPHLQAALICERLLQERDGVLSAIRIIDRITHTASGPNAPEQMPTVPVNVTALISFKSGSARGRHTVQIRPETPSGVRLQEITLPVLMEGEDRGGNLAITLQFQAEQEGLYWFDVFLDGQPITRMPLRIVYQRLSQGTQLLG